MLRPSVTGGVLEKVDGKGVVLKGLSFNETLFNADGNWDHAVLSEIHMQKRNRMIPMIKISSSSESIDNMEKELGLVVIVEWEKENAWEVLRNQFRHHWWDDYKFLRCSEK